MSQPWVAIQRNPKSGAGSQRRALIELMRELQRQGLSPRVFTDRAQLRRWVEDPAKREALICIVAAGGDGTAADVMNRYPGVPVALLPTGTENLLSKFLGIPRSGKRVGAMIASGSRRVLDLCEIGTRKFAIMASAGFDADVIHRSHSARQGHITRLAYCQHIWQSLRHYSHPQIRVFLDDDPTPRTARLAVIVNLPVYALGLPVARSARGDDGLLDIRLFENGSFWSMVRYFVSLALGMHEGLSDVTSVRARHVRLESDVPVPIQIDGDPAGTTPANIRVLPGSLEIFAPPVASQVMTSSIPSRSS